MPVRFLLVDDEPAVLESLSEALTAEVLTAQSAERCSGPVEAYLARQLDDSHSALVRIREVGLAAREHSSDVEREPTLDARSVMQRGFHDPRA